MDSNEDNNPKRTLHFVPRQNADKLNQLKGIVKTKQDRIDDERWLKVVSEMQEANGRIAELTQAFQALASIIRMHVIGNQVRRGFDDSSRTDKEK